jgi:hypothetical protein
MKIIKSKNISLVLFLLCLLSRINNLTLKQSFENTIEEIGPQLENYKKSMDERNS